MQDKENAEKVPTPDPLPRLKRLEKETYREELGRLQHNFIEGVKRQRRSAKKDQVKIVLPKRPIVYEKGLNKETFPDFELDLNADNNIISIADD